MKAQSATRRFLSSLADGDTNIYLSDCDLGDSGAALLVEALNRHPGVRNLNLARNRIGDEGAILISQALDAQPGLQMLCLTSNRISDQGAKSLAEKVERHPSLRLLAVDGNFIGNEGASELVLALACNRRTAITCTFTKNVAHNMDTAAPGFNELAREDLQRPASLVRAMSSRGITIGQLLAFYADCCSSGRFNRLLTTTFDVVMHNVLGTSRGATESWVEQMAPDNPPPAVYVVHAWGALFSDLVFATASHAWGPGTPSLDVSDWIGPRRDLLQTSYFIDAFSVNQHVTLNHLREFNLQSDAIFAAKEPGCQVDKLPLVLDMIRRRQGQLLVAVDSQTLVLQRLRCLWEVHRGIKANMPITLSCSRSHQALVATKAIDARTSSAKDRRLILDDIRCSHGGIHEFDDAIRRCFIELQAQFESYD